MEGTQSPAFISFQSNEMSETSMEVFNSKQIDTIMSLSNPQYFQGNTWVTSTSTWDIHMQTQVPCILTIHFGMSVLDYRCHFDTDNSNFETCKTSVGGDLTNLMSIYPGHTMNMSGALYQRWRQSFGI